MLKKVLVANRGEIALRVIRSCRELDIATVAVYSTADRGALHVRAATAAVEIGPPPPNESYLCGDKILAAAEQHGVDAIHPGYGFLSENAEFAEAVQKRGIRWIGPPPRAIERMGEKVAARRTMEAANVPVVPGVSQAAFDPAILQQAADQIGYPLMIKAAAGGGGKGIRIVEQQSDLVSSWERARSEARSGFGNDAVYLEKYLPRARHIELQILADEHGNVIHLGERECSLQRRHQKVWEEAPSPVVDATLRQKMGAAAVAAAKAVDYVNAGTVEFLVEEDLHYYFLEMNTRLQVEHPVTEFVTGLDLVREQLRIAAGEPLSVTQDQVEFRGHAIEARICAEEPGRGFMPATGTVASLQVPGGGNVRFDSGLYPGLEIGIHYDPMLAKLIVGARDRDAAVRRLRRALQELKVAGVNNNIAFLLALCDHPEVQRGEFHTKWLEEHLEELNSADHRAIERMAVLAAAVTRDIRRRQSVEAGNVPRGGAWVAAGRRRAVERWRR